MVQQQREGNIKTLGNKLKFETLKQLILLLYISIVG